MKKNTMTRFREKETLTQSLLDVIATYMDNDIREDLAFKLAPCDPEIFLKAYVDRCPNFTELLKTEFNIEL